MGVTFQFMKCMCACTHRMSDTEVAGPVASNHKSSFISGETKVASMR